MPTAPSIGTGLGAVGLGIGLAEGMLSSGHAGTGENAKVNLESDASAAV